MTSNDTLEDYLNLLASSEPTPGGGAATAFSGAQAVSLLQMMCNLTQGKKFTSVKDQIENTLKDLAKSRSRFMALKQEDEAAFENLMSHYRLPKATDDEANYRQAKIKESIYLAAKAPLGMLEEAVRVLPVTQTLMQIGNKNLITDVGVAIHLLDATIQGARLNILINTRLLNNPQLDQECKKVISTAEKLMSQQKKEITQTIDNFLEKSD